MGRYAESIRETERAIALDGANPPRLSNLALAQLRFGKNADAMESARAALRLKPDDAHAHYMLGIVLLANRGPMDEVTAHLEIASRTLPAAKTALERIAAVTASPH
jgi:tetratricopeptide (TPR) repeat protein